MTTTHLGSGTARSISKIHKDERRRASRAQPVQAVEGVEFGSGTAVCLRDFSATSFAVETTDPMTGARLREFEFPVGFGRIAFKGIPKRRARLAAVNGVARYLVALEFTWGTPTGQLAVEYLVRSLRGEVA